MTALYDIEQSNDIIRIRSRTHPEKYVYIELQGFPSFCGGHIAHNFFQTVACPPKYLTKALLDILCEREVGKIIFADRVDGKIHKMLLAHKDDYNITFGPESFNPNSMNMTLIMEMKTKKG